MEDDVRIFTLPDSQLGLAASEIDLSKGDQQSALKSQEGYTGPVRKSGHRINAWGGVRWNMKPSKSVSSGGQGTYGFRGGNLGGTNSVADTLLGLTDSEIELLRQHQQMALMGRGSGALNVSQTSSLTSSRATSSSLTGSRATSSSQLLLDPLSLQQTQLSTQLKYDRAGNVIAGADAEIARMRATLEKIDEIEKKFDEVRRIRDAVKSLQSRSDDLDKKVTKFCRSKLHNARAKLWQPQPKPAQQPQSVSLDPRAQRAMRSTSSDKPAAPPRLIASGHGHTSRLSSTSAIDENLVMRLACLTVDTGLENNFRGHEDDGNHSYTYSGSNDSTAKSMSSESTGSEDSFEDCCSPIEREHHLILEAVMVEFYALFHRGWISGVSNVPHDNDGRNSVGNSSSSSNELSSSANQSSASSTSNIVGSKRPNQDCGHLPPDENQDGNKRPRLPSVSTKGDNEIRRYACPFFKRDPLKYGQRGSCTGPGYKSISHLKEHLYRCHLAPVQCPRCWIEVGDSQGLELHLRGDAQCEKQQKKPVDGISERKLKLLKSKKRLTPDPGDEARWGDIYRILFPGVQPIPSPYYEHESDTLATSSAKSSPLSNFGQYTQSRLPSLIETHVEQILQKELRPVEARIKSMVGAIASKCVSDLVKDWQMSECGALPGPSEKIQSPSETTEEVKHRTFTGQGPSGGSFNEYLHSAEASESHNPEQASCSFFECDLGNILDAAPASMEIAYPDYFTQAADTDWTTPMAAESTMNIDSESLGLHAEDTHIPSFFCLENPPHSITQSNKGKGRKEESFEALNNLCRTCFGQVEAQDPCDHL